MALIDDAIELLKKASIEDPDVVPPPSEDEIAKAEHALNIKFPPSFLKFIKEAGSYQLPYWETYWVGDDSLGYRNIIEANRSEHEDVEPALPDFLITFQNNGYGDQICFDTRSSNENGEYKIVFWDHELSIEENLSELEVVADDFANWLIDEINNS